MKISGWSFGAIVNKILLPSLLTSEAISIPTLSIIFVFVPEFRSYLNKVGLLFT